MATRGGARPSSAGNNESLIIGILVGMVLGLAAAGGVAWYLATKPSPYASAVQSHEAKPVAEPPKPAAEPPKHADAAKPVQAPAPVTSAHPAQPAPAASAENKQRFEFYKILTDKQEAEGHAPKSAASRPAPKPSAPQPAPQPAQGGSYFVQAGSFSAADEADKLKARIALLGMEPSVQTANVPDKGTRYRVRVGPYHSTEEVSKAVALLKQNGIVDTATMHTP